MKILIAIIVLIICCCATYVFYIWMCYKLNQEEKQSTKDARDEFNRLPRQARRKAIKRMK